MKLFIVRFPFHSALLYFYITALLMASEKAIEVRSLA